MDEAAFRAFYERTAQALLGYLVRATSDRTHADDLLQEAYLRLLQARIPFTSDDHARRYLFRIATNLLFDRNRRRRRDTEELSEDASVPARSDEIELRADFQGPFGALSLRDRTMLWLAHVEGSSHEEIAAALNLRTASIRVMLHRARARLASLLREKGLGPETRGGEAR